MSDRTIDLERVINDLGAVQCVNSTILIGYGKVPPPKLQAANSTVGKQHHTDSLAAEPQGPAVVGAD